MERLEKQIRARSPDSDPDERPSAVHHSAIRGLSVKRASHATRYFGQNSPRVLLNLFDEAKAFLSQQRGLNRHFDLFSSFEALHQTLQARFQTAMTPITVFVDSMMPVLKRMNDILPKKPVCDRLVASYFDTSEIIYRVIHLPSFSEQYELFWDRTLQLDSFLPLLLSILAIASRFETKSKGLGREYIEGGVHIPTACALVRNWLGSLKGKQLVELSTLQIELLLLHAQRLVTPRAHESWTQLGFVVRLAMTMGLHRDPSEFEPRIPVTLGEIRRRLWFTLVDMDLHMSMACNLPCLVRDGDFSCRPPRNLDDAELKPDLAELPPTRPIDQVTDNQLQVYAAMTLPTRMRVAPLINRVDSMRNYQELLKVGARLERFLDDINHIFPRHGLNDAQKSKQWRSRVILDMHVRRPLLALYRPLAMGVPEVLPQVSRAYLRSSMVILRYLDELDPSLPHLEVVTEMYHQVLKRDVIQAALSVCFFIRSAVRPGPGTPASGPLALHMSPDAPDDHHPSAASSMTDSPVLWSLSRLVGTVQKTLQLLIGRISGGDTKDIICISVVLETARTAEPKADGIARELYRVLDACLGAANMQRDKLYSIVKQHTLPDARTCNNASLDYMDQSIRGVPADMAHSPGGWVMWEGWD